MAPESPRVIAHLRNQHCSVVVAVGSGAPFIAYLGAALGEGELPAELFHRGVTGGGLDNEVFPWLVAEQVRGWMGRPGIQIRRSGPPLFVSFAVADVRSSEHACEIDLEDSLNGVKVCATIILEQSGCVVVTAKCMNTGSTPFDLDALTITVPISGECTDLLTLGGRHGMEAMEHHHTWERSHVVIENRSGRTSHENLGVVFAASKGYSEDRGDVCGVHLAWSGNFGFSCDSTIDGLRFIQVGELLLPGEVVLKPGDEYEIPSVIVATSTRGVNGVSQKFHRHVRGKHRSISRPVILNTWEAVYFSHDLETLKQLASCAAQVGVERFVLDDGWFHGRRDDKRGLGDWWVDNEVWPDGLEPLISHVHSLGIEFGLWFEPEMVNPNSDLFRSHPDWVLDAGSQEPILGRHQMVLNMAMPAVREYLFEKIDLLLSEYQIEFVKWDHNRPLVGASSHAQTLGTYELLGRLKSSHPRVQFESCASGGGRIDMGIMRYADRFWVSDSIDALDRLAIQKGVSKLIPLEMIGSHIGAPICHTTGRHHALSFRTATAMFGWLGIEWNLLSLSDSEIQSLANSIASYKQYRDLVHTGDLYRSDHPDTTMHVLSVVAQDQSEALISISRIGNGHTLRSAPIRISGLDAADDYLVTRVSNGNPRWALHRELPRWVSQTTRVSGSFLMNNGLPCPPLLPESTMLVHAIRVPS